MGFDDLFKHGKDRHYGDHGYNGGHQNSYQSPLGGIQKFQYFFEKLKNNRKWLKLIVIAVIVAFIIAVTIVIGLITLFAPLIGKLFGAIQKNGISGLVETVRPWLDLLWSGSGK